MAGTAVAVSWNHSSGSFSTGSIAVRFVSFSILNALRRVSGTLRVSLVVSSLQRPERLLRPGHSPYPSSLPVAVKCLRDGRRRSGECSIGRCILNINNIPSLFFVVPPLLVVPLLVVYSSRDIRGSIQIKPTSEHS